MSSVDPITSSASQPVILGWKAKIGLYLGIECTCLKVLELRNIGFATIEAVQPQITKTQ